MDFGESTRRVEKLIGRAGVDFQPTSDYLTLLKTLGAPPAFLDAIGRLRPTGTPSTYSPDQETGFGHLSACLTLASKGQFPDAERECQAATNSEPSVTYFALADVLSRERNYEAALRAVRSAEKADPSIPDTHILLGLVLAERGDKRGAKKEYRKAIQLDPDYDSPYNNLVALALQERDLKAAYEEVREALRVDPDSAATHNNLGTILLMQHDLDGGIAELRKAVLLEPNVAFRHSGLAEALIHEKGL